MWLFYLLLLIGAAVTSQYTLIDASASVLGTLTLTNNLIGDTLLATVTLDASRCILCNQSQVHLFSLDTLSGVVISHTKDANLSLGHGQCQSLLRLVVVIEVTLNDTTAILLTPLLAGEATPIACNSSVLYREAGINCTQIPLLGSLFYELSKCLVTTNQPLLIPSLPDSSTPRLRQRHSPTCWYLECLNGTVKSSATLCGEPICAILYRSDLYLNECGPKGHQMTPWYQMAVQLITYRLNYGEEVAYRYVWWVLGTELLERHCDLRRHPLSSIEHSAPNSFFRAFIRQLSSDNSDEESHPSVCGDIKQHFDDLYNSTMAQMLYNQWYYDVFKFTLLPDRDMEIHAILLVCFFCILPFLFATMLGYCIFDLRRIRAKNVVL